jgi:hypothetical protein
METRRGVYDDIAGGYRKKSYSRHGHEVRVVGTYEDGEWLPKAGATGLGVDQWIAQRDSKATLDNEQAIIPAGPSWQPYARDEDNNPSDRFHTVQPSAQPYFAIPGVHWMWPEGETIGLVDMSLPDDELLKDINVIQATTIYRSYCEVRSDILIDKDGFSVKKPLTFLQAENRQWSLFTSPSVEFQYNMSRKSGAVEFLIKMDLPPSADIHYGADKLDPDSTPSENEHTMSFLLKNGSSGSFFMGFGLHAQNAFFHMDRATTETIDIDPVSGAPTHYTAGITGVHWSQELKDATGSGVSFCWSHFRDADGNIIKFEWNKWYRIRYEWTAGFQPDGTKDYRVRVYWGDPLGLLESVFTYVGGIADWDIPNGKWMTTDYTDCELVSEFSFAAVFNYVASLDPNDPNLTQATFDNYVNAQPTSLRFGDGYGKGPYTSPSLAQKFHLARIGVSWDPGYIEYGLGTQLGQDPYPAVLEAVVEYPIWDEDVVIEVEYYPAIFREYQQYFTAIGDYDVKTYKLDINPKTFTFTIPKFTRPGCLFQGPVDFGHLKSVSVSGSGGQVSIHSVITDGAKVMHSIKPFDLIDSLYKVGQSIPKVPRLCPRCNGTDDDCILCNGKKYLVDDAEIPEFILDNFLKAQQAPYQGLTYREKLGLASAAHSYVNPSASDIKNLVARLFDVDPTSIATTVYAEKQNVLVTVSIPRGTGPNSFFNDIGLLQWILDSIRPVGVEFLAAYQETAASDTFSLVDEIWGIEW